MTHTALHVARSRRTAVASTLALAVAALACSREQPPASATEARATPTAEAGTARTVRASYVAEAECQTCHAAETAAWRNSHHALAMAPASETSVRADFADTSFTHGGVTTRFAKRDGKFVVETTGPDGAPRADVVKYTFGVEPLQQYLVERDAGRVQCLTVAWDTEQKRWFDLYPDETFAPSDALHWTGRYQRWNVMCAQCHSTNLVKGYDAPSDGYATTWSSIEVACQACHGPGSEHAARAHANALAPGASGFAAPLRRMEARTQIETCGPCHAMRTPLTDPWIHGEPFLDHFRPELLRAGTYAPDGQMAAEVYVYGSFLQSKMAQRGVACSDCHDPHSLGLRASGNLLCTQCHQLTPPLNRFPTLRAKLYDSPEHHHHAAGSAGASCAACHMPAQTFMVLDVRRDHSFRIPRPDLSAELGVKNACTDCHADKDSAWATSAAKTWWPELAKRAHFGAALASARRGDLGGATALARDPETPAIVRATALESLGVASGLASEPVLAALRDPDALVRFGALAGIARLAADAPRAQLEAIAPLLTDPVRVNRIEAARIVAPLARKSLVASGLASFERAQAEFEAAQHVMGDLPGAHLNLAVAHAARGELAQAETEYRTALRLDPAFLPARFNLAQLLHAAQRSAEAEALLREGLVLAPESGELHHSLGLLLNELGQGPASADELVRATQLLPDDGDKALDAAFVLKAAGRVAECEQMLVHAAAAEPRSVAVLSAVAQHFADREQWIRALPYAEQLTRLLPADPDVTAFVVYVRERASQTTR